jgi:hypothetical protein
MAKNGGETDIKMAASAALWRKASGRRNGENGGCRRIIGNKPRNNRERRKCGVVKWL